MKLARRWSGVALWISALVAACAGNDSGGSSVQGGAAPGNPTLQSIAPTKLFRGRATAITVAAVNTSFSNASQLQIGGGKISVANLQAISSLGLRADATVPVDFPGDKADVTVDGLLATAAVDIADAVALDTKAEVDQGGSGYAFLLNLDPAHPFDGTVAVDAGKDVTAAVADGSGTSLAVAVSAAPSAVPGARDLTITLGTTIKAVVKGAIVVKEVPLTPFVPKMDNKLVVPKGKDRAVVKIAGIAGKLVNARVLPPNAMSKPPRSALVLVDPAKGYVGPLSMSLTGELLAAPSAPDEALLYTILLDAPFDADTTVVLDGDVVSPGAAADKEPNEDIASASAVMPPAIAAASLAKKSDVDVYAVAVTNGTLVVRTLPDPSAMPAASTDTKIEILDANQKVIASNDDEEPNSPYSFAAAAVTAGTVFVRVTSGVDAFMDGGPYRLAVLVR